MHGQSCRVNGESDTAEGGVRDGLASACNSRTPFAIWIIAVDADDSVRSCPCIIPTIIYWPAKSLDTLRFEATILVIEIQ